MLWKNRRIRPDAPGVIAKPVFERRQFSDGDVDQVSKIGAAQGIHVGLHRREQEIRCVRHGAQNRLAADHHDFVLIGDGRRSTDEVLKL